jgi:hypothetical protein
MVERPTRKGKVSDSIPGPVILVYRQKLVWLDRSKEFIQLKGRGHDRRVVGNTGRRYLVLAFDVMC